MDHTRDPCPWVILNDFGGAFCMGVCIPYPIRDISLNTAPSPTRPGAEDISERAISTS